MLNKVLIVSILALIISIFCGDNGSDIIATLFSAILFSNEKTATSEKVFTKEELKLYNGVEKPQLYLAILGNVIDVTRGAKHYGPNQQYNIFVGRDATRSFVTGEFSEEGVSEDIADFSQQDLRSINHWLKFYKKEYRKIGKLIGKYFNENGKLTPYGKVIKELIIEAELAKDKDDSEKAQFPPCNIEWDAIKGTRVWCSEKSGGIERDWIGVPRQLYEAGSDSHRCACINEENEKLGSIKEYVDCDKNSPSCFIKQQD